MRVGDLGSGAIKLRKAWKKLMERWEDTRPYWKDSVSRDFEKNHLAEFEPPIVAVFERMKTLTALLETAINEVEK
jgi:hypothetical protein